MPHLSPRDAAALLRKRHPEWVEHQKHWRWLLDSFEGGDRYRHADYFRGPFDALANPWYAYGWDSATGEGVPFTYGQIVQRNLVPHLSEMSPENRDLYALRLNRTPVPTLVARVIRRYLSRIYARQVTRSGAKALESWWEDVDGRGAAIGPWMRKTVGPLLLALGQIDLVFGHPETPEGETVATRADARRLKLDGCVADFILPENLVWWRTDGAGRYLECLVHVRGDGDCVPTCWRHWTATDSNAYTPEGEILPALSFEHPFGRVPIERVFDERRLRCRHTGQSRMSSVAELMKSIYNRRSELVLGDVQQSHALLQGPEDYCQAGGKIPMGPGGILPKKRGPDGNSYEGFDYLDPPKSGAAECRTHVLDDLDEIDREAALLKPAGMTSGTTVAQSGVSKQADQTEGNDLLSEIASTLRDAEIRVAKLALVVLSDGAASESDLDAIDVEYPREFDLFTAADLAGALADIQVIVTAAGGLPQTEGEILKRLITVLLPGLDDERLAELHDEVTDAVALASTARDQRREAVIVTATEEDPAITLPNDAGAQAAALNTMTPDLT